MKIAILGCGAIGGLFLAHLSEKGHDLVGIVKQYQKEIIEKDGLVVEGIRGQHICRPKVDTVLSASMDLVILSTKINDIEKIVQDNAQYIHRAVVLTTQNGILADYILNRNFRKEDIITGIVMFGSTMYSPNKIIHNFEGGLIVGNIFEEIPRDFDKICAVLKEAFNVVPLKNIKGAKYLKMLINLNNCIPALLGLSMQETFTDQSLCELAVRLNKEAYQVIKDSGIVLQSLPDYPKERLEGLVEMNLTLAAEVFSKVMTNLSKEPLYGSILQSIKRGNKSEIDFINGQIVKLALDNRLLAPLNGKVVELVHKVETTGKFFSREDILKLMN